MPKKKKNQEIKIKRLEMANPPSDFDMKKFQEDYASWLGQLWVPIQVDKPSEKS